MLYFFTHGQAGWNGEYYLELSLLLMCLYQEPKLSLLVLLTMRLGREVKIEWIEKWIMSGLQNVIFIQAGVFGGCFMIGWLVSCWACFCWARLLVLPVLPVWLDVPLLGGELITSLSADSLDVDLLNPFTISFQSTTVQVSISKNVLIFFFSQKLLVFGWVRVSL